MSAHILYNLTKLGCVEAQPCHWPLLNEVELRTLMACCHITNLLSLVMVVVPEAKYGLHSVTSGQEFIFIAMFD